MPEISFSEGIKQATEYLLETDPNFVVVGLGANYKSGIDGTIGSVSEKYPDRVVDTPLSEFSNSNACVGMALNGLNVHFCNGRTEFALFCADAILTQSSKWSYMMGGEGGNVPIVFRIAIGRAWGGSSQHSQQLYSIWANCTGLKAVVASSPQIARDLLYSATLDKSPVVFCEPRWIYNIKENVDSEIKQIPLDQARIVTEGKDITLVTYGEGVYESLMARKILQEFGISVELIDIVSINPIDHETIAKSVKKTNRLLCVEMTNNPCSPCSDVLGKLFLNFDIVKNISSANLISCPHCPVPGATSLTEVYYPTKREIVNKVLSVFELPEIEIDISFDEYHLAPKSNLSDLL